MALHWQQRETDLTPKLLLRLSVTDTLPSPPRAGQNKDAQPMGHGSEQGDQDTTPCESKLKSVLAIH